MTAPETAAGVVLEANRRATRNTDDTSCAYDRRESVLKMLDQLRSDPHPTEVDLIQSDHEGAFRPDAVEQSRTNGRCLAQGMSQRERLRPQSESKGDAQSTAAGCEQRRQSRA